MDWLSEIEQSIGNNYEFQSDIDWEQAIDDLKIMARVLREFGGFAKGYVDYYGKITKLWKELSNDAKELCVAARESSREE